MIENGTCPRDADLKNGSRNKAKSEQLKLNKTDPST
jgi:hypothetical protein